MSLIKPETLKKSLRNGDYHSVPYKGQCPENENTALVEGNTPKRGKL